MSRTHGCPVNVREWVVEILTVSRFSRDVDDAWARIGGVTSFNYSTSSTTEEGGSVDELWAEPFVTKRSGTLTLEMRRKVDAATGHRDPGQYWLDYYAQLGGCDADTAIRLTDPYGHRTEIDVIVTGNNTNPTETTNTSSCDLQVVGAPVSVPYVQVEDITLSGTGVTAGGEDDDYDYQLTGLAVGSSKTVSVTFDPLTSSNQKFSVAVDDPEAARIEAVGDNQFTIRGLTADSIYVTVRTMNNAKTKVLYAVISE